MDELKKFIRDVKDFPKPGIIFKDITPLLQDAKAFNLTIDCLGEQFAQKGVQKIIGVESRGFIFGAALSQKLGIGFVPVRKQGKLPWDKVSQSYNLEYGTDQVEMHVDSVAQGEKVLIVDDLLATGGTIEAVCQLIEKQGGVIESLAFVIELDFLEGRKKLQGRNIYSLLHY